MVNHTLTLVSDLSTLSEGDIIAVHYKDITVTGSIYRLIMSQLTGEVVEIMAGPTTLLWSSHDDASIYLVQPHTYEMLHIRFDGGRRAVLDSSDSIVGYLSHP